MTLADLLASNRLDKHFPAGPKALPSAFGWCCEENRSVFRDLLSEKTRWILEVGSYHGLSTRLMLDLAPNAQIVCVDTWQDFPQEGHYNQFETFAASCWELRERIVALPGDSTKILPRLVDLGFRPDLIYVDGDHTLPVVFEDCLNACRFPGTQVIGDDYAPEFPETMAAVHLTALRQRPQRQVRNRGRCWGLGVNP